MIAALAIGVFLAAPPQPDVSWVLDDELAPRAAAARTQADAAIGKATADDASRAPLEAKLRQDQSEQASDQAALPSQGRVQRGLTQSRLQELATSIADEKKRIGELETDASTSRAAADRLRAFADAASREDAARKKQAADAALAPDSDVHDLPNARLAAAKAWAATELARIPKQQAALDQQLSAQPDVATRGAVAAKMDALRVRGAQLQQVIALADDELRYRTDEKRDELLQASNMSVAAAARASALDTATPAPSLGPDGKDDQDRFLDRVLADQDAAAAASVRRRHAWTTGLRYAALTLILAGGLGGIWWVLKKGAAT